VAELSPAAQAVMDAFWKDLDFREDFTPANIAAALRAVADQVVPEHREHCPNTLDERYRKISAFDLRNQFLAIAAELDNTNPQVKEVNPVTELQPLKFTDSVNNIEFRLQGDNAPQEIIRLDSKGFYYRGQLIEDAGEAHQLMVEFLKQSTQSQPEPVAPADEDLLRVAASKIDPYEGFGIAIGEYEQETECAIEVYGSELIAFARAVLARWGTPTNNTREEN
jgi:hypothetical protein